MRNDLSGMTVEVGGGLMMGLLAVHNGVLAGRADAARRSEAVNVQYGARLHAEVGRRCDAEQALAAERRRSQQLENDLALAYKAIGILRARK